MSASCMDLMRLAYRIASVGKSWVDVLHEVPPKPGEMVSDYMISARELFNILDDDEDGYNFDDALESVGLKRHRHPENRKIYFVDRRDTLGDIQRKHGIPI